uniref:Uncharacterized protein n=1 Tax=viral metagenome TaxID=1070528 RepID=A0A6C0BM84_9ZZZZ
MSSTRVGSSSLNGFIIPSLEGGEDEDVESY